MLLVLKCSLLLLVVQRLEQVHKDLFNIYTHAVVVHVNAKNFP